MANDSENLRRYMNLMDAAVEPEKVQSLMEGWVDNLKNKIGHQLGNQERIKLAKKLTGEWYKWIGQTRREGTEKDLLDFMTKRIGFKNSDIKFVLDQAGMEKSAKDVPADATDDEEEPQGRKIRRGAQMDPQDDGEEPEDEENEDDDGIPLPKDPSKAKLNDYKDLKPGDPNPDAEPEAEQSHDEKWPVTNTVKMRRRKFQKPNGDLDYAAITAYKEKHLKPGEVLKLIGDDGKPAAESFKQRYPDEPERFTQSTAESINEAPSNQRSNQPSNQPTPDTEEPADPEEKPKGKISKSSIEHIMDICAGRINDEYLLNGPKNDKDYEETKKAELGATAYGSRYRFAQNAGGKLPSGQYDKDELVGALKELGMPSTEVPMLLRYINKEGVTFASLPRNTQEALAKLGFAFLRARS